MVPEEILDSIDPDVASNTSAKRIIKTARRQFRSKSPNDVDHYIRLATTVYVLGDVKAAITLLVFLDENTGEFTCGRVDLAGSLAIARLVLAYIFELHGENEMFRAIMSREGLSHSMNVNSFEPEYKNIVQEMLHRNAEALKFHECNDESTRTFLSGFCRACMVEFLVLKGRMDDIRHTTNDEDVVDLLNGIEHYRMKFLGYLAPK